MSHLITTAPTKYFAFISYNSKDLKWGKQLQRKLEHYRLPATLCSERGWGRTPLKPIFFAPTDIQPGDLTEEIKKRLRDSQHLIVICSPNSARSEWVGKEIAYFHSLGRTKNIHFFIVDGVPHSGNPETECFNPVVQKLGLPEILGANIHEKIHRWAWLNKERAYVQLISKLLGVEFDTIWQRHKRLMIQKIAGWCLGLLIVITSLVGVWIVNQAVEVKITLHETSVNNSNLPPLENAVVRLKLDNEVKTDTVLTRGDCAVFPNIPSRFMNQKVGITFECQDFFPIDTALILSPEMTLNIKRTPEPYGKVRTQIYSSEDERGVSGVIICIEGDTLVSDANGYISTFIPLEKQRVKYVITSSVPLQKDTIIMPSGEDDVLLIR